MADSPNDYRDPYYAQLASAAEAKYDLPPGLVSSILTKGERSNADQVSEAGARTVAQIIPATRDAALKKYGVDAYLSPENAVDVSARLLKDSLDRNGGNVSAAVGEYHGGTDRANWGAKTHAYIARVTDGVHEARTDALQNDFSAFMKANPAVPSAQAAAPEKQDSLSQDFAAWHAQQPDASQPTQAPQTPQAAGPGIGDQAIGVGEAALAAGTSPFAYLATLAGGGLQALKEGAYALSGDPSFKQNAPGIFDRIGDAATRTGEHFQYQPRTGLGQGYAHSLADALQPLAGMNPLEASLLGSGVAPAATAATAGIRTAPAAVADGAGAAGNAIRARVAQMTGVPEATPGTFGSAGAAGTDLALQRQVTAENLPVKMKLTTGQATRDFTQQQFEGETAKSPDVGEPLRENAAKQNQQLAQNFDALIDRTGAEKASDIEAGRFIVDDTLKQQAAASKARYKAKYDAAEKAGELEAPVSLQGVVDHLNTSEPEATTAPLLSTARNLAIKLGIAKEENGTLVAPDAGVTLKTAEQFRKAINRNTDFDPANQRQASAINGLVDQATEGKGGALYKEARKAYQRHAQLFKNNAIVSDLLETKPGTSDRRVALDDVMHRIILQGSREDLTALRRTLHVGDQQGGLGPGGGAGGQAWKEVQGSTLRYIADQAGATGKNASRDTAGRPIISFAGLNKAVRELDDGGRLDFLLGKKDAQTVRDIAEIASVIKTVPPGSVNTSNTAAVLLAALGEAGATAAFTGIPAPLFSIGRMVKQYRDRAVLARKVQQALDGIAPAANDPRMRLTAPAPGGF